MSRHNWNPSTEFVPETNGIDRVLNGVDHQLSDIGTVALNISVDLRLNTIEQVDGPGRLMVDSSIAGQLRGKVRVLCWILTHPDNHRTKAVHVRDTWGHRCNKFLIMSSAADPELPTIQLNVTDDRRDFLWGKTKLAWQYVYKHHLRDADWFYKADDDTFASLENMRLFLAAYSARMPIYFGYKLKALVRQGYMSGGSGYVLSRTALMRFVRNGMPDHNKCLAEVVGAEDAEMGKCLENVGVLAGDSRDRRGRGRFFIHNPGYHLHASHDNHSPEYEWYWNNMFYPNDEGLQCCSSSAIAWHYVQPEGMYMLNSFHYHLTVYGRVIHTQGLPKKVNFTEVAAELRASLPNRVFSY